MQVPKIKKICAGEKQESIRKLLCISPYKTFEDIKIDPVNSRVLKYKYKRVSQVLQDDMEKVDL